MGQANTVCTPGIPWLLLILACSDLEPGSLHASRTADMNQVNPGTEAAGARGDAGAHGERAGPGLCPHPSQLSSLLLQFIKRIFLFPIQSDINNHC